MSNLLPPEAVILYAGHFGREVLKQLDIKDCTALELMIACTLQRFPTRLLLFLFGLDIMVRHGIALIWLGFNVVFLL